MKLFNVFKKRSKALYEQAVSSMFDSNNPETAVEKLIKSTETEKGTFERKNKDLVVFTPLYEAPSTDYYMDSKEEKGKEQIAKSDDIQENGGIEDYSEESVLNENNGNRLIYELANLLEELNRLLSQTDDENAISTITFCENRIVEIMLSCGCEIIDKDMIFDHSRHVPSPFSFVQNGCEINETIKPGLSYKNRVLVKATVECKKQTP